MTPGERRALRAGGVVIVSAICLTRVIPWAVHDLASTRVRLESDRLLLAETRSAIAALPRLEDSARVLTGAVVALAPALLAGSTAPTALADLSGRLNTIVERHHARVVRFTEAPDSSSAGPLHRVTAVVELETDFRGLAECLVVLARDPVMTVVERVSVTPADPLAPDAQAELLTVEARVVGWYLTDGRGS